MSKIIRLEATNFKRLRAVDITPEDHLNVIAGRNAQGKTSVLDAITAALGGSSAKATPRPIRDGESSAEIVLETEDLIVTRTFTASGTKVSVVGKDGVKHGKGQAKLDGLLGQLSLDPLGFTQLADRDQLKTLLDLVDLPFDPAALEAERAAAYEDRTVINRDLKALHARTFDLPADCPTEEVSLTDLLTKLEEARRADSAYEADASEHAEAVARVDRLQAELDEARRHEGHTRAALATWDGHVLNDAELLRDQIQNVEQTNAQARQYAAWKATQASIAQVEAEAAALTAKIADIDRAKADGLKKAKFPVDGLGFDTEGITYRGVPFKQASGAEQLRVSLAMAIALNPELRVIRIADGSLLDNDSLDLVERMAIEHDYQVWIEMVSDTGDFGIVIEDGSVV